MTINGNAQLLTQPELERTLWAAANALRGPVDAGDFKAYVFPVMFFKWVSDNWDYRHARAVSDWGDDLTPEIEYADYQPFVVPNGCHWSDVHGTAVNVGAKLGDALDRIQEANRDLAGVFGDVQWTNTDRLPESALTALLDTFHPVRLDPDHVSGDLLGNADEYLLREFAEASGKKAGEFFTPRHVVHLLVKILDPKPGDEVVDPACGSGGMLVETVNAVRESGGNPDSLRLHGQEINLTTSAIAKMNLYLHGLEDFEIRRGDTFRDPKFTERGRLRRFDVVIA
ncbi:MAG: class I SAM-dependent DNA methyltransferase, partial [Propionicimonas sp.]|nr:class I SAM-dependent DNA methyltransferase [Propionicimonas sp.]